MGSLSPFSKNPATAERLLLLKRTATRIHGYRNPPVAVAAAATAEEDSDKDPWLLEPTAAAAAAPPAAPDRPSWKPR